MPGQESLGVLSVNWRSFSPEICMLPTLRQGPLRASYNVLGGTTHCYHIQHSEASDTRIAGL